MLGFITIICYVHRPRLILLAFIQGATSPLSTMGGLVKATSELSLRSILDRGRPLPSPPSSASPPTPQHPLVPSPLPAPPISTTGSTLVNRTTRTTRPLPLRQRCIPSSQQTRDRLRRLRLEEKKMNFPSQFPLLDTKDQRSWALEVSLTTFQMVAQEVGAPAAHFGLREVLRKWDVSSSHMERKCRECYHGRVPQEARFCQKSGYHVDHEFHYCPSGKDCCVPRVAHF